MDRDYVPDLGRVLYSRETGFAPDAPADVLARPLVVPYNEPPQREIVALRYADAPRRERPAVCPRERPKRKLAYRPRRTGVTIEKIRTLQARGMVAEQIATRLGCHADTIYARIREANGGATRPKQKLTPEQRVSIVQRRDAGEKAAVLAVEFRITPNRVYELCKALKDTDK